MKTRTKKLLILVVSVIAAFIFSFTYAEKYFNKNFFYTPQYLLDERVNIVATWISEVDPSYKLVFQTGGTVDAYYDGVLAETFNYSISNETPQCGIDVYVNESEKTSFLRLESINDGSSDCFIINGVQNNVLSLSNVSTGALSVFNRQ